LPQFLQVECLQLSSDIDHMRGLFL
jgi:hypothetical protein